MVTRVIRRYSAKLKYCQRCSPFAYRKSSLFQRRARKVDPEEARSAPWRRSGAPWSDHGISWSTLGSHLNSFGFPQLPWVLQFSGSHDVHAFVVLVDMESFMDVIHSMNLWHQWDRCITQIHTSFWSHWALCVKPWAPQGLRGNTPSLSVPWNSQFRRPGYFLIIGSIWFS